MRFACWFACVLLIAGLFAVGRTQYAVGFVPSPWDKPLHVAVFALLTFLLYHAFGARAAGLAALVALGIAAADEGHQFFLPGRSSDLADIIADTVGIALAAAVLRRTEKE